jgi:hypothetical protein
MLLLRTETLPDGPEWIRELKFDGYRSLAIWKGSSRKTRHHRMVEEKSRIGKRLHHRQLGGVKPAGAGDHKAFIKAKLDLPLTDGEQRSLDRAAA